MGSGTYNSRRYARDVIARIAGATYDPDKGHVGVPEDIIRAIHDHNADVQMADWAHRELNRLRRAATTLGITISAEM